MSSGIAIVKRSLLVLTRITLLALSLGWGVAQAQPSFTNEVIFVTNSVMGAEGTSQSIQLDRIIFENASTDNASATVSVDVGGSTAERGKDYLFDDGQIVSWGPNESGVSSDILMMTLLDDGEIERDETVILKIVMVSGDTTIGSPSELTVTIQDLTPVNNTEIQFQKEFYDGDEDGEVQVALERLPVPGGGSPDDASAVVQFRAGSASSDDISFSNPTTVNWFSGDTETKVISIPLLDDLDLEGIENFFLEIVRVEGDAVLGAVPRAQIEIRDQYPGELVFVREPFEVVEDAVNNFVDVQIERVRGSAGQVNVTIGTTDISATNGTDYERVGSAQLNWNDGETGIKSVRYQAKQDSSNEGNETFEVSVIDGFRNIGPGSSTVTIIDGSPPVNAGQVDFDSSTYSGSEAGGSIALTLRRSGGSDGDVTASVNLFDVTATFPFDGSLPGSENVATVAWSDGDAADKTVILTIEQDLDGREGVESFDVVLSEPTNGLAIGTLSPKASVFIDDSPMPDSISFDPDFYTVDEAGRQVMLNVSRTGGAEGVVTVDFDILDGTGPGEATEGRDFTLADPTSQTLRWGDGDGAPKLIIFDIIEDTVFEDTESFSVDLFNPTGGASFDSSSTQALVDIIDNDPRPSPGTLSFFSDYTVSESMLSVSVEVLRNGGSTGRVRGIYSLGDSGDSATLGEDYALSSASNGELVWEDGDSDSKFIVIDIALDDLVERDEHFSVSIVDSTGGVNFSDIPSVITITDTPPPADEVRFVNATDSIAENGDFLGIELRRSGSGAGDVEVVYGLVSGTASYSQDFRHDSGPSGSVFWPSGDLTDKTIGFDIIEDLEIEGDETFTLQLSIGSGAGNVSLGTPNSTTITIIDVPPPMPGLLSLVRDYTVSESMLSVSVEVTRTRGSDGRVTALYRLGESGDTAAFGQDYGLSADPAGELVWEDGDSAPKFIDIDIALDDLVENDEQFQVSIVDTTGGADFDDIFSVITITDTPPVNDIVSFVNAADSIAETGDVLSIEVQRSGLGVGSVEVFYDLVSGTATLGADFNDGSGCSVCSGGRVFWPDGDLSNKTIEVDIFEDLEIEGDETFTVELSIGTSAGNVSLGMPNPTLITIIDVPPPAPGILQFDPDLYAVSELDGSVMLSVTRTGGSDGPASILYSVLSGTAITGEDHGVTEPISGTLEWPAGDADPRFITVDIVQDDLIEEPVESFSVSLSSESGAAAGTAQTATVNITDSTMPDTVAMTDADVSVNEDAGVLSLEVQRSGSGSGSVRVFYDLFPGTATPGLDYGSGCDECTGGSVFWPHGDLANKTIEIDIFEDLLIEGDETFTVRVQLASGTENAVLGTPDMTIITIIDMPPPMPGLLQFDPDDYTVSEMGGSVELVVTRTGGSDGPASVSYSVGSDTATVGVDHAVNEPVSGLLEWIAGDATPRSIIVDIAADDLIEAIETFPVDLSAATGAALGQVPSATVSVMDSTLPDVVVLADDAVTISEGVGVLSIVVQRVGAGSEAVSVNYSISDGTAVSPDDYAATSDVSGTVNWAIGDTADKTIDIDIVPDLVLEDDETFLLSLVADSLSNPVTLGSPSQTLVTITDVAPPMPGIVQFDPDVYTVAESDGLVELIVTRTGGSDGAASVAFEVTGDTAELGADIAIIEPVSGTLDWAAGDDTTRTITVDVANDELVEGSEEFTVLLSNFTGSEAGSATSAMVTLMDSTVPTPDTVVFADDSIDVDENAGLLSLIVQRVGTGDEAVSVSYEITDETAVAGADYGTSEPLTGTVSWAAGDTADKSIVIDILNDDLTEPNETFQVTLGPDASSVPVLIGTPGTITVKIVDTTIPPVPDVIALAEASQTRLESDPMFELVITRNGNGIGNSAVDWVLSPASASLSDDIDLDSFTGTVSWTDGQTDSRTVEIPIVNDALDESNETLTLSLTNVQGASLGAPASSQLTIIDDDEPPVPGTIQFNADSITVDEDAGVVSLTVTRTEGSDGLITVVASTVPGSAGAADFSAIQTLLSWDDGDTSSRELVIPIEFDTSAESTESFSVILSGATPNDSVLGSPMTATVNINDVFNGSRGTVQFASEAVSVNESDDTLTVSVTRVGGTDGAIGVNYSTSADSATAGDDFDNTSGTLTWADGDGSPKTFSVAIATDTISEDAEQFRVTLDNATPVGAELIGTPDTLIVTINNVEPPPEPEPAPIPGTVQFVSSSISSNESAGTVSVSVERVGGTDGAVSVRYDTVADSAVENDDFQPASGRLQWADGENDVKILSIALSVDDIIEDDERFRVVLSDGQPVETILGTTSSVEITIVDDSIAPPGMLAFVEATLTVAESDQFVDLQVARTDGSAGSVSVGFSTVERSADSTDFVPVSGRLNWDDGDTDIRTIRVPVNRDVLVEAVEQFQVVLDGALPLGDSDQLGLALATVSISDSTRLGSLGFAATEISVSEIDSSVTLSVTRSDGSDGDVSVDFATVGSSAESGADFVDQSGTLSWPDGDEDPRSITILINTDNLVEGNEQFVVALSNPQPLGSQQLGEAQTTITIIDAIPRDDETTPPITTLGSLDLVVVSGDGQGGLPGDLLDPLVIDVVDLDDAGAAVDGLPIRWRAVPAGSAELLDGVRTVSDESGRSSNRVRIISRGFLNVVATIDVSSTATSGMTTRIMPPEFPVGQGEAVFTVRSGLFAADGLNNNQAAVGATLDVACEVLGVRIEQRESMTAEEQDLFATCQEVEARLSNDDGLAAALDRLLPEELFAIGDSVIDTTDIQVTNVYARINAIRSGRVETLDVSGLQYRHYDQSIPGSVINAAQNELSGGGAAADSSLGSSRLGFFANGSISYGDVDGGENQSNASVETTGLTLGIDYRATDTSVFGAGLGFIRNTTDFNPDAGKAEVTGLNFTLFGTYFRNQSGYVDAVLDIGRNSYDITRRINLPNTPDQFGIGDTNADVLSFTIGAGKDFTRGAWEFGPYGRFSYIDADVDGYSERATGSTEGFGSVLNIRAHSVRSTRLALGGQLARTVSTTRAVFIPQLRLEAEFEQEDKKEGIQATFQHDPTQTPFTVNGEDRDKSYFNLGIGSSAFFANGRSGFLFYETQLGNDRVTQHFLKLGMRLEF